MATGWRYLMAAEIEALSKLVQMGKTITYLPKIHKYSSHLNTFLFTNFVVFNVFDVRRYARLLFN